MNSHNINTELYIYTLQNNINTWLYTEINSEKDIIKYIILLLGGLVTGLNPCLVSIIALSSAYKSNQFKRNIQQNSFILGLSSSLITIVILISFLNYRYHILFNKLPVIGSLFTILIGLTLLQIIKINAKPIIAKFVELYKINNYIHNYMIGFFLGFNAAPCSSPTLITILIPIYYSNQDLLSISYIATYLLGYIFPLILIILLTSQRNKIKHSKSFWDLINHLSSCFVIGWATFDILKYIL